MTASTRRVRWRRCALAGVALAAVLTLLGYWWWRDRYPYGWSHCCDKQLSMALRWYADEHRGAFPAGGGTPEASLSLLHPQYASPNLLRGKTVSEEAVRRTLGGGGRLGPETCGWHYVEGLRATDDHRLALCWDKAGLGHNGERLLDGGHYIIRVGLSIDYIPGERWAEFRREQRGCGPGWVPGGLWWNRKGSSGTEVCHRTPGGGATEYRRANRIERCLAYHRTWASLPNNLRFRLTSPVFLMARPSPRLSARSRNHRGCDARTPDSEERVEVHAVQLEYESVPDYLMDSRRDESRRGQSLRQPVTPHTRLGTSTRGCESTTARVEHLRLPRPAEVTHALLGRGGGCGYQDARHSEGTTVAVVLFFFLVVLVLVVAALLVMAVGGTLASVGACLLLRDAVSGERAPDPVGLTLLVGGAATFVTPVLLGVGLYLAG